MSDFYDKKADEYFESTAYADPSAFLGPLLKHLKRGATVLDVGCGSGRDLLWSSKRGFLATGLERSERLADLARQFSGCPVHRTDFLTHDFSQHEVDALLLVGSLCHLEYSQLPVVLSSTIKALKSRGYLYISLKEGKGEMIDENGRLFYLWKPALLEEIFMKQKLHIVDFSRRASKLKEADIWLGYLLQKKRSHSLRQ